MRRHDFIKGIAASAVLWPLGSSAQQAKLPTIGFLCAAAPDEWTSRVTAFRQGLSNAGYVEGQNVSLTFRYAEYHYERLPEMAADLVRQSVNVVLASGGDNSIKAAMAATSAIPIVFTTGNDPVSAGYVKSLNRPGGNATGITFLASSLEPKRLEILREIDPNAKSIAVFLGSANSPRVKRDTIAIETAAKSLGLSVRFVSISREDDLAVAFRDVVARREDAIHLTSDPFFATHARTLAALAATAVLPLISGERGVVAAGGLLSYGASSTSAYRQAGTYAGLVLKGKQPGELPVQQSTTIELVINLKTAKSLGLTVPLPLLGRADEVIE